MQLILYSEDHMTAFFDNYKSTVKSIGVESIEFDGIEDVYNMEVADNHNFAVNGGLIVHNCMDNIRYFVATTGLAKEKTDYKAVWD